MKIGYLIPEFPGQTHNFFWQERKALAELGVETILLSTRKPPPGIVSAGWAETAIAETAYLLPFSFSDTILIVKVIYSAGPKAIYRCLNSIVNAEDLGIFEKFRLFMLMLASTKLVSLSKEKEWQHVHVHSCANAADIALFASTLSDLTYSITLHGPELEMYGKNQKQKWENAEFAIVVSDKLLHDVKVKLHGHLPSTVISVPMGINPLEIQRKLSYKPWKAGTQCRLFSCGRLNPVKGHEYLFETLKILKKKDIDVILSIAGEDEQGGIGYHQFLQKLIEDEGLLDSVNLLGAVSQDKVREKLEEAHIFVLASHNEGIPVAVMEAMAMQTPVVVTNVGGNSELIESGKDGILVPDKSPEEMASAIKLILDNSDLAIKLSQASRSKRVHPSLARLRMRIDHLGKRSDDEALVARCFPATERLKFSPVCQFA